MSAFMNYVVCECKYGQDFYRNSDHSFELLVLGISSKRSVPKIINQIVGRNFKKIKDIVKY